MQLLNGDCLQLMKQIPNKSIDMILCDLPYGTTACKWDSVIPFEPLWEQYKRIIKDNGAIVLFGSEPFASKLRMSNIENYKYDWIWVKNTVDGFMNARCRPLKKTENIMVFSQKQARAGGDNMSYYPQNLIEVNKKILKGKSNKDSHNYERKSLIGKVYEQKYTNYPINILEFARDKKTIHPTQKPVALLEYLIKTYSNEDDIILDNCMGSGSTGVACVNTGREFIGIELDENYYNIAKNRISQALNDGLTEHKLQ